MNKNDDELSRFLHSHAPTAPDAPRDLEDRLLLMIQEEKTRMPTASLHWNRAWSMVSSAVAAAAVIASIVWFRHTPAEPLTPIAKDLELSWDGVLVNNQDIGLQSLFSDLD